MQRIRRITQGVVATVAALLLTPALGQAACPAKATAKVFTPFGDTRDYSLVDNGGFEAGTGGWSLTRAAVTAGNEPWKVRSRTDTKSLTIQPGGVAVSPAFCVGIEHPVFRLFARRASGSWAGMNVKVRWTTGGGRTVDTVVGSLGGGEFSGWGPSRLLPLATTLPLWHSSQSLQVRLVFDPEDAGGAWAIDDVYVDPYRK